MIKISHEPKKNEKTWVQFPRWSLILGHIKIEFCKKNFVFLLLSFFIRLTFFLLFLSSWNYSKCCRFLRSFSDSYKLFLCQKFQVKKLAWHRLENYRNPFCDKQMHIFFKSSHFISKWRHKYKTGYIDVYIRDSTLHLALDTSFSIYFKRTKFITWSSLVLHYIVVIFSLMISI